ncbi:MAG: glycosyltransferase family 4 protein [Acidobacteria bacterium]|nr:glycosyltransferase family 4 protein [Acidobacteriota bacterium]
MRIAYITAGAAGMYCGSCLHDNTLAAALMAKGHEVALMPTYTPARTDEEDVSIDRVFYGALNVFLEQKSAVFRHIPEPLHWLLDRPQLLKWISGRGVSIDASELGDMTLSVAKGEAGNQRREVEELVGWLRDDFKPDIVHITNSMFLGLAEPLKREVGVPVLCSLQGEDIFLDQLSEPFKSQVREQLQAHVRAVDGLVATCDYYAGFMAEYLDVDVGRIHVVPLGIKLEGHRGAPPTPSAAATRKATATSNEGLGKADNRPSDAPFAVGYLARICPEKGLHELVEALATLAERVGKENLRLRVAGYLGKHDEAYFQGIEKRVAELDLTEVFDYVGEVSRAEKIDFLQGIDVLSVPTTYRDPKGLFVLEALANGIPVVQPAHGSFPEMIAATGGGLLFEPGSIDSLTDKLEQLMREPRTRHQLGSRGAAAVHAHFSDADMAEATLGVYRQWVQEPGDDAEVSAVAAEGEAG